MKTNWQTKKLGEICEVFTDGDWIEKKNQSTSGIRLIQTGNIGNGNFLDRSGKARYISVDTFKRLRCTEVLPGDCLLSRLPDPVGRAGLIPDIGQKMITAVDCTIMRFKKDTLPDWFIYFSLSPDYQSEINKEVTGATRQRISRSNLGNVKIPVPPVSEQKQLVKVLDVAFEKISKAKENAEKNLQNARELFESYLQSVFANPGNEWEKKDFEDAIEKITYTNKIQRKDFLEAGEFPVVSQEKDLVNGYWNDRSDIFKIKKPVVIFGDHTQILKYIDFDFVLGADGVKILQPKDFLYPKLFYYLLKSITLKSLGYARHYRLLKEKQVLFPKSIPKQRSIVAKLDVLSAETKKLEAIYQQKLADLEELKKSILKKVFNGEFAGACS